MGGGYYDDDVSTPKSSGQTYGYGSKVYSAKADKVLGRDAPDPSVLPLKIKNGLACNAKNPLVLDLDGTGSMGTRAKTIFDRFAMFWGQLRMKNYLEDPSLAFGVTGDANGDRYPIQVSSFEVDSAIKKNWEKMCLEGGGGGQGMESYELHAFYFSRYVSIPNATMPLFFFVGDEGFYPKVYAEDIRMFCDPYYNGGDIKSADIFKELTQKFNVFLIHNECDYKDDKAIVRSWQGVLGKERVIILEDPEAVADVILGCIALMSRARDLDDYLVDMKGRDQTDSRISLVKNTLTTLGDMTALVNVGDNLPTSVAGKKRTGGSKRIS
jgi:hypothetical protein